LRRSRGFMGYLVVLATFLTIAILLNGGLGGQESRRIEYPALLEMIGQGQVEKVAIRNNAVVGLVTGSRVNPLAFPDHDYDFETTIGADFVETVRQMRANELGKPLDEVSVNDLTFTIE